MTIQQSSSAIGLKRCAVCKIDLKGRFVYLDEKIEDLLGYTREDLFGKSLLDFVDEPSQKLIEQLLSHRNHYETFFDSTSITLYDQSRNPVTARAVVSLNFIAGNPVNYQLIIDQADLDSSQAASRTQSPYDSIVENILAIDGALDWRQLLQVICRCTKARQACVYLINGAES